MPTLKLFANLRKVAGLKETSLPGETLAAVVAELIRVHPALEAHLLEDGQLRRHVTITLNGQPVDTLDVPIHEQDEIAIFPPMAGG